MRHKRRMMFNKSGERDISSLALHLRGNAFSFSPLSMMLAVCLSYMAFVMLAILLNIFPTKPIDVAKRWV